MKTPAIIIIFLLALVACSSKGDKVSFGSLDVYYTDGVSEDEAKDVRDYLSDIGFGLGTKEVIQLSKTNDRLLCKFVMHDGKASLESIWRGYGNSISKEVFDGAPVDVDLCDSKFKSLKFLPAER